MESIWSTTAALPEMETLNGDMSVDVAVIGAGLCGVLVANFLGDKGLNVAVLEADRVGSGQTKNTTAKITSQHSLIYKRLIDTFGEEKARVYAEANQAAISEYQRIIEEHNIECDFEVKPAYLYSTKTEKPLRDEVNAAKSLGIPAEFTTETGLPFPVKGAVRFDNQAQVHPLKFLYAMAQRVKIFEKTLVKEVKGGRLITDHGVVTAKKTVVATHYPFIDHPGYYFLRMHQERSYVVALENAADVGGMYIGIDPENAFSFRNYQNLLLLGGGGHRTGENSAGGKYQSLRDAAKNFFPDSNEVAHWSAQDCMTLDGIPYIGRYSLFTPDLYVATGFKKWGFTSSMVAAMILSDLVLDRENPYASVFSPQRSEPPSAAKSLFDEGVQAVKGLGRRFFGMPDTLAENLAPGRGGIVEHQGEKYGVYKDDEGKLHVIVPRCQHLGCQLEWNPDEKSWDCPCHGSRYDYEGNLIDNPAMKGLND